MNGSWVELLESNIGMWLNHQWTPLEVARSAGAFFLARNPDFFRKNAEVKSYCDYIESQNSDIVFLTEVCGEEQRDDICNFLESQGYNVHYMRAFELWNMDAESHRYLYNIIAAKGDITVHNEFTSKVEQRSASSIYSFARITDRFWENNVLPFTRNIRIKTQKFAWGILDGAWAHCEINGTHFWLLHAHPTSRSIIENLRDSLPKSEQSIIWWDFNLSLEDWEKAVGERFSFIKPDKPTFPYYWTQSKGWIFTRTAERIANKVLPRYTDQFHWNELITWAQIMIHWPEETWLWGDHAVSKLRLSE